ncbi:MAG: M67 family metallopeptidase [Candidatus Pristimantibacillus sp.]
MNQLNSIAITSAAYEQLISLCRNAMPNEACGILIAELDHDDVLCTVTDVKAITNRHPHPQHSFSFDPVEWTTAYFDMQKNRQKIVGFFHSHPSSEAIPSLDDENGFWSADGEVSYWIISMLNQSHPVVQPFKRTKGTFTPISLVLA